MKTCKACGAKIKQTIWCYSSGDGSLSLSWNERINGEMVSAGRKVTRADAVRYLNSKDGEHLKAKGWIPFWYNKHWHLVKPVKRVGPNKLRIDTDTYSYTWDKAKCDDCVCFNSTFTFKTRIKGNKWDTFELKNQSTLMVLRFFLNHEQLFTEVQDG